MESTTQLIDDGEEEVFLQQLEMYKQRKVEFTPETERLYVKLLWRKVSSSQDYFMCLENDGNGSSIIQS